MPKSKNILVKLKNKLKKKKSSNKPINNHEEQDNITQASTIDSPEQTLSKVIGPHIHYESSKISQIHSESYLNDTRRLQSLADQTDDERSHRSDSDDDGEALQHLYDGALESFTSPQMKIIQENDDHRQAIKDHKRKLKEGTAADKLLNKLLGRRDLEGSFEEDYETFVVSKLSPNDKSKHRDFFRQLDGDDDTTVKDGKEVRSDNSVAASMKSNAKEEEEQSVHTHNSRSTHNSRTTNGEHSTLYDQSTTYTDHTNATSSTSFFKRMYCACNGSGQQIEDDTTTVKEVKIHPVARVYHIEHKDI